MKSFIRILLFLILPFSGLAQDTTIIISPKMATSNKISLGNVDGWIFRQGNDAAWAKKDINTANWEKLKPSELSEKLADKHGKLEGWLRIKIKLDTVFRNTALDLFMNAWSASEVYVDGNLLYTFGNTGINGKPFKEYNPTYKLPLAFNMQKGDEHILAIHFVDFLSSLPPHHLKSEGRLNDFISITTPAFKTAYFNSHMQAHFYRTLWLFVNIVLCLLFWLLTLQIPAEKNLFLIALTSIVITLTIYCDQYIMTPGVSYHTYRLLALSWSILRSIGGVLGLIIMFRIFRQKITSFSKILLGIIFICGPVEIVLNYGYIIIFQNFLIILIYAYYIIICWKTLKGAQWAILVGILSAMSFGFSLAVSSSIMPGPNNVILVLYTGVFLSAPISALIYVAMRFKEIIKEVQHNAKQVVRLSEEKKEQALSQQKTLQEEVNKQTAELRNTLRNLQSTQAQLIQSEKMASLGELTAGIAHEIQNPLNFVNNFSEVNKELIGEMKNEIDTGNLDEAKTIAKDIEDNEEKIIFHGKRADAIVKGMLQHSRASSGVKEPTDINALADEYLRLAYHGLRAKDKSFNATMRTDYDDTIGNINIVPQDIGRVILNLITNAFYAATLPLTDGGGFKDSNYKHEPTVWVSTKNLGNKVEVKVKDNGPGIPQKILDKIFQPFFTTKPTGQGTGLGLSLSYDIVKAHGGELKVETKEGEGAEFIIQLPVV
ncbi:MAG: sensor histidine kinase [Chitinophagales bacterium]